MILIFLIFVFPISAEYTVNLSIMPMSSNITNKNNSASPYSYNSGIFNVGELITKDSLEKYSYNFSAKVLNQSNSISKFNFFMGDNFYISSNISNWELFIGRKLFNEKNKQFNNKDGIEGITARRKILEKFILEFYLYDYYRGFPLLEKNYFNSFSDDTLSKGERSRHGFSFYYNSENYKFESKFLYLNLGEWGKYSKDSSYKIQGGDKDFIYHIDFSFIGKFKFLTYGSSVTISRGLDKTANNSERKEKSIPVTGESIHAFANIETSVFNIQFGIFLPDSDKKNRSSEIINSGFIGMGAHPMDSIILSQLINYYPSGWITPYGLEKENSYISGRRNSGAFTIKANANLEYANIQILYDYIIPRKDMANDQGLISVNRRDYSRSFLSEIGLAVSFKGNSDPNYIIKLGYSYMFSAKDAGIKGTLFYASGGMEF